MAEAFEVEVNGQVYEVEADTPQQAATYARLLAAREQGTSRAVAGAKARGPEPAPEIASYPRLPLGVELDPRTTEGKINLAMGAVPMVHGLVTAPLATAVGIGSGMVGEEAGNRLGRKAEEYGAPGGTSKVLGLAGGLAGGIYGGMKTDQVLGALRQLRPGGLLGAAIDRLAPQAATSGAAATGANASREAEIALAKKEADLAIKQARLKVIADREARAAELHTARMEKLKTGKVVPIKPKAEPVVPERSSEATARQLEPEPILPDDAVSVVPDPVLPKGQRAPATNLGGKAKPAPAATSEVDLEDVLRRSIEAAKAAKAAKAAQAAESPLRQPRLEVGAERVGKGAGLTKEEVRLQTGPRLDEALGEASPILPDVPLQKIIDTMKALPRTGGLREAYVARATSGKTKWQVENIRRTLEHLGLLAPVAAGGAALSEE